MKTKLVKRVMAPLAVVVCGLLTMVAATATGKGTQGGRLEWTWEMQITLNDCSGHVIRSFPTLVEFVAEGHGDRGEWGYSLRLCKTGGKGVWSHATTNNYAFRFKDLHVGHF